jgi:hypothetical protein
MVFAGSSVSENTLLLGISVNRGNPIASCVAQLLLGTYSVMRYTKQRFDEVLHELELERRRVDEDLSRLTSVAAYLRALLPQRRRRARRRRCTARRCTPRRCFL